MPKPVYQKKKTKQDQSCLIGTETKKVGYCANKKIKPAKSRFIKLEEHNLYNFINPSDAAPSLRQMSGSWPAGTGIVGQEEGAYSVQ